MFYDRDLLGEECEAWVHGPVFPLIYDKYKVFGRQVIPCEKELIEYDQLLTQEERRVIDYVLRCFGIYNGSVLRTMIRCEKPWCDAREGLGDMERCTNLIKDEDIRRYFEEMDSKYNLQEAHGVEVYIKSLNVI